MTVHPALPATSGRHHRMTVNQGLRGIAGAFILISVALGIWVSPWFLAFTAFVGANLLQSAFTRSCPMMWVLRRTGCPDD